MQDDISIIETICIYHCLGCSELLYESQINNNYMIAIDPNGHVLHKNIMRFYWRAPASWSIILLKLDYCHWCNDLNYFPDILLIIQCQYFHNYVEFFFIKPQTRLTQDKNKWMMLIILLFLLPVEVLLPHDAQWYLHSHVC